MFTQLLIYINYYTGMEGIISILQRHSNIQLNYIFDHSWRPADPIRLKK